MPQRHPVDNLRLRGISDELLAGPEGEVYTYAHGRAIGVFDFTGFREQLPPETRERDLEAVRRAIVGRMAERFGVKVHDFRYFEKDRTFNGRLMERVYSQTSDGEVVETRIPGKQREAWYEVYEVADMRDSYLRAEADFVLGPDWHTGLKMPSRDEFVQRSQGPSLVETEFRDSGEIRSFQHTTYNRATNQAEDHEVQVMVRAFGETPQSPPALVVISDQPENQAGDLWSISPRLAHRLQEEFGLGGFPSTTRFLLHYPANVRDNNHERFVRAEFGYDPTPAGEEPRPYLHHSSSEPGAILARNTVAALIGEENLRRCYPGFAPRSPEPTLAQQAFEVGLDPSYRDHPGQDLV